MVAKLNRYMLTDEIYKMIKERILSHEFVPGSRINIDQLARTWEVSNIPIREALSRLASEGLVTTVPFKGMFVSHMSLADLKEHYEIRMLLEPFAVVKATKRIPDCVLVKVNESTVPPAQSGVQMETGTEFLEYTKRVNQSVHGVVLEYCDNNTLKSTLAEYSAKAGRYLNFIVLKTECNYRELAEREYEEHRQILEYLIQRDEARAQESMRVHLSKSFERTRVFFA